jgi:hypothetical protein
LSESAVDLAAWADLADIDKLACAVDGEYDTQSSDPCCSVTAAAL